MPYYEDPPEDAPWLTYPRGGHQWTPGRVADVADEEARNPFAPQTPAFNPNAPIPPTTGGGGGGGGGMTEEQGRAYDLQHGLIGGYMTANGWVSGSPSGGGGGGGGGGGFGGGMPEWAGNQNWPGYQGLNFDPGPAFTYKDFVSPSAESMLQEPGFQFRMDQGRKALESSAAGKGVLRSGGTLKDILGYGQNFASQEYGNVWNRALTEYDTNRNNQFGIHQAQYGQRGDQYRFAEDANRFGYNAKQRQAELDAREMFDRWSKQGDWTRDIAGFGMD